MIFNRLFPCTETNYKGKKQNGKGERTNGDIKELDAF
jgi:hypothetical protein